MPLSEDEQRILQEIETQFYANDPHLAGEIGNHSIYTHCLRQMKWAGAVFAAGVVVLGSFVAAFLLGAVPMFGALLVFEANLRTLGRAGLQQVTNSARAASIRDALGNAGKRARGRIRRDDEPDE